MQAVSTRFFPSRFLRGLIAVWLAGTFGVFTFAGVVGLSGSRWVAALLSAGVAACIVWLSWKRPVIPLDEKAASPALGILFVLAGAVSLVQLARLCVFIVNPAAVSYAIGPNRGVGLPSRHLCMTAYYVAAQSVKTVPNVYDEYKLYSLPTQDPNAPRKARTIGSFDIDAYEYPPPFLLLPRAVGAFAPQFLNFRMLWFALYGSVVLIGLLAVARMFDPVTATRVLLLSPLVLGADITVGTLQIGNVQAAVFVLAMLAMVLFTRRFYAVGGALLAFAAVSKLFPGMLIVYLASRREWRALAWTVGLCAALVGISFLDTGPATYNAFLHQLPRLLSGEAFPPLRRPSAVATNLSVPGFLFKLKLFGLSNGSFELMKIVGSVYTLILIAAIVAIAMRRWSRNEQPIIWLAVLILASLRSPFLPQYGIFPALWLLILLASREAPAVRTLCLMSAIWVVLNISLPVFNGPDPRLLAAMAFLTQIIMVILLTLALRGQRQPVAVLQPAGSTRDV